MTHATKLIAVEIAVIVIGLSLAFAGHGEAALAWFAGYVVGYRKCLAARRPQGAGMEIEPVCRA